MCVLHKLYYEKFLYIRIINFQIDLDFVMINQLCKIQRATSLSSPIAIIAYFNSEKSSCSIEKFTAVGLQMQGGRWQTRDKKSLRIQELFSAAYLSVTGDVSICTSDWCISHWVLKNGMCHCLCNVAFCLLIKNSDAI